MKKLLLASTLAICSLAVFAQNATYRYKLNNRMNDEYWVGPNLTTGCTTGTYLWKSLPIGTSKFVYAFDKGCGLYFNDSAGFLSSGSYTIELYFMLDSVKGYKKLIDFDSLGADAGLYSHNSKLDLYPSQAAGDSVVLSGQYLYVALTRDGTTNDMKLYYNDTVLGSYNDNAGKYKYGTDKVITFFQDDNGTKNEQSSGAASMIYISNYAMDSATVVGRYKDLSKILNVSGVAQEVQAVKVFPNPAADYVNISTIQKGSYCLFALTGKKVMSSTLSAGNNHISLEGLPSGMYLLQVSDADGAASGVYKLSKR